GLGPARCAALPMADIPHRELPSGTVVRRRTGNRRGTPPIPAPRPARDRAVADRRLARDRSHAPPDPGSRRPDAPRMAARLAARAISCERQAQGADHMRKTVLQRVLLRAVSLTCRLAVAWWVCSAGGDGS